MNARELREWAEKEIDDAGDMDGFDLAFYEGIKHILLVIGDGGISEQYIAGIKYALDNLDIQEIGGID